MESFKTNVQHLYQPWSTEELKTTLHPTWDALPEEILKKICRIDAQKNPSLEDFFWVL
jgi:hypothetical protein